MIRCHFCGKNLGKKYIKVQQSYRSNIIYNIICCNNCADILKNMYEEKKRNLSTIRRMYNIMFYSAPYDKLKFFKREKL